MVGKWRMVRAAALIMSFAAAAVGLRAQEAAPRTVLLFGPRIGASAVLQGPADFNNDIQVIMHDSNRTFFPAFTEIGLEAQQLFPLGGGGTYLTFQQALLLGGLDQRMPLPSVFVTLGCRLPFGLEAGLGPYGTLASVNGSAGFALSMVYTLGWVFVMPDFQVPITLMFVPIPGYFNPRISLLFGVSFWMLR